MIYSLEAPHINEARDKKMDELETLMAMNEKKVRNALHIFPVSQTGMAGSSR